MKFNLNKEVSCSVSSRFFHIATQKKSNQFWGNRKSNLSSQLRMQTIFQSSKQRLSMMYGPCTERILYMNLLDFNGQQGSFRNFREYKLAAVFFLLKFKIEFCWLQNHGGYSKIWNKNIPQFFLISDNTSRALKIWFEGGAEKR